VTYEIPPGAFEAGATTTLFELGPLSGAFEVAPDDKRFLFVSATSEHAGRDVIRVVWNGFDLLRADAASEAGR
jgi:hypothetical protein